MNKKLLLPLLLGAIVIAFILISSNNDTEEQIIKIGVIAPLTGDVKLYGEAFRKTADLAVEKINRTNGVDGKNIKLIYEDGKCNGKNAASAMSKLVNIDHVKIVVGGICSSESLAAVPIADQNGVLLYSAGSSSSELTGKSKYFVRNFPSDATQGALLAGYAINNKNVKKIAILQEQQDYALGIYKAFEKEFSSLGGEIFYQKFSSEQADFRTMLTKAISNKPDALFIISNTGSQAERIIQSLDVLNWKPALLVNDNVAAETKVVQRNAMAMEGAVTAQVGVDPENPKFLEFQNEYYDRYGQSLTFTNYDPIFYDSLLMIRDGLLGVGYDPNKLVAWLKDVKGWQGASGEIDIKENGDRASGYELRIIKNGKIVPIE